MSAPSTPTELDETVKDTTMGTSDADGTAAEPTATGPAPTAAAPRIRTAGIVWGLILAAISAAVIVFAGWPQQRTQVNDWAASIGWPGLWAGVVIAIGVLVLILVGLSVVKRAQLRRRAPR